MAVRRNLPRLPVRHWIEFGVIELLDPPTAWTTTSVMPPSAAAANLYEASPVWRRPARRQGFLFPFCSRCAFLACSLRTDKSGFPGLSLVGETGFEPATVRPQPILGSCRERAGEPIDASEPWQHRGNSQIVRGGRRVRKLGRIGRFGRWRTHLDACCTVQVRVWATRWRFESSHPHFEKALLVVLW
jgi:hypothetical protein